MVPITLEFQCWVYGEDVHDIFNVDIPNTKTIGTLKEIIKEKKKPEFDHLPANNLGLYRIPSPSDADLEDKLKRWDLKELNMLNGRTKLSILFPRSNEQWLIIVNRPHAGPRITNLNTPDLTLSCWIRGNALKTRFPVRISSTALVGTLQQVIKDMNPMQFCDMDATNLTLYKLSIQHNDNRSFEDLLDHCAVSSLGDSLCGMQELSTVFPSPSSGDRVHLIIEGALTLQCWIRGEDPEKSFSVRLSMMANVDDLKHAIKAANKELEDVVTHRLSLYKILSSEETDLRKVLGKARLGRFLQAIELLGNVFDDVPLSRIPWVVVEQDEPPNTIAQICVEDDILTALNESFMRTTTITSKSLTPSQAAKSNEYLKTQSGDRRILDCRCPAGNLVNTVAPPIQLFNPAFAYFASKAFNPEYDVSNEFLRNVQDLMVQFALIHTNENARRDHLKSFLKRVVQHPLLCMSNADRTAPDLVVPSSSGGLSLYLIVGEEKNEFGEGGSDPSVQAAFSFLRIFSQKENEELLLRCCCPAFIIAHAGPWLTIMGGVITANCVVQRLTDFLWIPARSTHDDTQCHRIARVLFALRESIQHLNSWYQNIEGVRPYDPLTGPSHPRFFPSPNKFRYDGALIEFTYQKPLERNVSCVTYLAKTSGDSPKDVVVKFVTSYGVEAHRKMASAGFAPQLLYHGLINVRPEMPSYGTLRMVVMEYVEGCTLEDALKQQQLPSTFGPDLRRAFKALHAAGYVFGDLRPPNVLVTPNRKSTAQLIDFDWAGKEGDSKYPVSISRAIHWSEGVEGLALIRKDHDLAMLDSLLSPST